HPTPHAPSVERPHGGGPSHAPERAAPQGSSSPRAERQSPHGAPASPPRGSHGAPPREERMPPPAARPAPAPGYPRGGYQGGGSPPARYPRGGAPSPGAVHPTPHAPAHQGGHSHPAPGASLAPRRRLAVAGFASQLRPRHAAPGGHRG